MVTLESQWFGSTSTIDRLLRPKGTSVPPSIFLDTIFIRPLCTDKNEDFYYSTQDSDRT